MLIQLISKKIRSRAEKLLLRKQFNHNSEIHHVSSVESTKTRPAPSALCPIIPSQGVSFQIKSNPPLTLMEDPVVQRDSSEHKNLKDMISLARRA